MTDKKYAPDPVPGDFEHRSGDCGVHGVNVVFFRPKGFVGQYGCAACALDLLVHEESLVSGED